MAARHMPIPEELGLSPEPSYLLLLSWALPFAAENRRSTMDTIQRPPIAFLLTRILDEWGRQTPAALVFDAVSNLPQTKATL
jgi:hypothetical protein